MTKVYPMLAHTGSAETDLNKADWWYETKLDGIRCIAYINHDHIMLQSRTGKDITSSFPDIEKRLTPLRSFNLVLDGEIVCYADDNELTSPPDFQKLQTRLQRKIDIEEAIQRAPARFVAFDYLSHEGDKLYNNTLHTRREELVNVYRNHSSTFSLSAKHEDGNKLFSYVTKFGYEGVIAKRKGSLYFPGTRSHDWLKIKPVKHATVYIGGYTYGVGRRSASLGALIALEPVTNTDGIHDLTFAGLVGTGLTDDVAASLRTLIDTYGIEPRDTYNGYTDNCWNLPTSVLRRTARLFFLPHQMEVTYQERTATGIMRFPSFKRLVTKT